VSRDVEMLVEHYGARIVALLEVLVKREEAGLRIRPAPVPLRAMDKAEWEQGKRIILDRLDVAERGLTKEEIRQHLRGKGYGRFSMNIAKANQRRKCPLAELISSGAVIAQRRNIKHAARYWSRMMYLRNHLGLPDEAQQQALNTALEGKNDE
jgi:hypothetical protein